MKQFIENNTGLKDKHKKEEPLFEKKYVHPGSNKEMVSRLYGDGSLYYLTDPKEVSRGENIRAAWNLVSSVHDEGAQLVRGKLEQCCQKDFSENRGEVEPGSTSWKFYCGDDLREVIIKESQEGEAKRFTEVDQIISSYMDKIP